MRALVVFAIIVVLCNPFFLGTAKQESTVAALTQSPYTSGVIITRQLNLTQANVNASKNLMESSWNSNNTVARVSINSTDPQGETVSAVLHLDQSITSQAQTIKYDFELATSVPTAGSSGPMIGASLGLTSSNYDGRYVSSLTPVFPDNTKTASVSNVKGLYANGSLRSSLLFQTDNVTKAQASSSGADSTTLFQREFPGYAAGDGLFHHYSIELDLQSNRTTWIADDAIIATFKLSFVPSCMVFVASGNDPGNSAIAILKDPVETAILSSQTVILTTQSATPVVVYGWSGSSPSALNLTATTGQISSLQNQINHLNDQVGNLTSQNGQLQARNSQWFSQWWSPIVVGLLGVGLGGFVFMTTMGVKASRKNASTLFIEGSACPECGGQMPSGSTFCGECGNRLRKARLSCPQCGEQMPPSSVFCGECGRQMSMGNAGPENEASQMSASVGRDEKDEAWR